MNFSIIIIYCEFYNNYNIYKGGNNVGITTFPWIYFIFIVILVVAYFLIRQYKSKNSKK